MLTYFRQLLLCLVCLWLPASWAADSGWLRAADNDHASVRLRTQTVAGGDTRLLLDVQLEKGWKTYWRSPGEGGIAPTIAWASPQSVVWRWPVPQRFDVAGISTQGYHDRVSFPITLHEVKTPTLAGVLTLSTCSNVCILTDYPFSLDLSAPAEKNVDYDFIRAMGTLPRENGLTTSLQADYAPGKVVVTALRQEGWQSPALYLDNLDGVSFAKPTIQVKGDTLTAVVPVTDEWGDAAPDLQGKTLSLVLADNGLAQESERLIGRASALPSAGFSLWLVLPMALLGGLILNIMPCVLPVLAMKLGSVLQGERAERGAVRRQFLASVAGIIASFLALALMMTALRLSNQALGWGIQFQNPWFIAAMVMVLFSASLLGLFEIRLSSNTATFLATRGGNGLMGHFWQGAFATLLATPCTAPFLGTAVSVALVAPLPELWGIFLAMGLGMSLPWLLVAVWPGLALRLPRPGRWMNLVRMVLGIMMLGSALWLLTLLNVHLGETFTWGIGGVLALALCIALALRYRWRVGLGAAGLMLMTAAALFWLPQSASPVRDSIAWQPLSEEAIQTALGDGKRVFVDVTADWCVTCKANKYNVLLREDVQQALTAPDVVALRGDWSRPSTTISQFLNRRQSAAIPFNQIYGPGQPQGNILPPLLSREAVLNALSGAKGKQ
ncbi:protein-disulfide reductase DsbD family protein [Pseudocitrobacter cyperus]|uniref:Protein-disulfide reductase DsbD domain-containing protein n=1 Tax=Pseudocitrobacter cyperus TaxID=3112843 RepID=A0ABV0HJU9_9ENTR